MVYHIITFGCIVALYWLIRLLPGKHDIRRMVLAELVSQGLFAFIWLFFGMRLGWDIFILLAPAAGVWVSYLCFALDGSFQKQEKTLYRIGLGVFLILPLLTMILPPIGRIWRQLLFS